MAIGASRVYRGMANYFLHDESNVLLRVGLNEPPTAHLVPRSDQHSFVLETSNMHVDHVIEIGPLAQSLDLQSANSDQEKSTNLGGNQIV
jgi:hypothetical protein